MDTENNDHQESSSPASAADSHSAAAPAENIMALIKVPADGPRFVARLQRHSLPITCMGVCPEAPWMVTGSADGSTIVRRTEQVRSPDNNNYEFFPHSGAITSVAMCDTYMLSVGKDRWLRYRPFQGMSSDRLNITRSGWGPISQELIAVTINSSGDRWMLVGACGTCSSWVPEDKANPASEFNLIVEAPVRTAAYCPGVGSNTFAAGCADGSIQIFDVRMRPLRLTHYQLPDCTPVNDLSWSPSGEPIFATAGRNSIHYWDLRTGKAQQKLVGGNVTSVDVHVSGNYVLSTVENGSWSIHSFISNRVVVELGGTRASLARFAHDGQTFMTAEGSTVKLYDSCL